MPIAYFINPRKGKKRRRAKDAKGIHTHWHKVAGHERRTNPRKRARRKLSSLTRLVRSTKRAARRRKRFSPAQLAAQKRFAAMARKRAALARQARRAGASVNPSRRTGGSMARRKRRRSAAGTRKRRRRRSVAVNRPRRRRRRRIVSHFSNPRRRRRRHVARSHRRRHRRNPAVSLGGGGILRQITRGAVDGFAVTVGQGATNFVASKIPFGQTSTLGQSATQLLVGTLLGVGIKKVTRSERFAAMFIAGAYSNVIRKLAANTPLAPMLSGVGVYPRVATPVGVYPRPKLAGWAATPSGFPLQAAGYNGRGKYADDQVGSGVDLAVMGAGAQP